jgi:hypothetical protein
VFLIRQIRSLACVLLLPLLPSVAFAQEKAAPSNPRPAPQVTGKLIDSDGVRRLTLAYKRDSKYETFTGSIHSTCMLPVPSTSGNNKALELSAIPRGTLMTAFYVRHAVGKGSENVILEIRFERVPPGAGLPKGVNIPCFKAAENPPPK